ncbi:MAG TPA: hypothetical protein VFX15_04725 [Actinomycetes bacterium]|nr:hypothetical protein [Actinomycetes bacterium]
MTNLRPFVTMMLALAVAVPTGLVAVLAPPAAASQHLPDRAKHETPPSVVIVGIPGLRWADVGPEATPYLWELSDVSTLGQMTTRSARSRTCPADGWVQVGTGNRARYPIRDDAVEGSCQPLPAVAPDDSGGGQVERWDAVVEENDNLTFGAIPGLLGQTLVDNARCALASGPGSALGAADEAGQVTHWVEEPIALDGKSLRTCALSVVGVEPMSIERRDGELTTVDALVERIDGLRPANSLLMVLGISDLADERAQLHLAMLNGPGFTGGVLESSSTRRSPFVQLSDVAPTVLAQIGLDRPSEMPYQPMTATTADVDDRIAWFGELSQQADVQGQLTPPFFTLLVLLQAILYLGAYLILRRHPRDRTRSRVLGFTHVVAVAAAAGAAATYLANVLPWWQADHPAPSLIVAISLAGATLTAIAFAGPWRSHRFGPAGAIAGLTAIVLVGDLLAGAPLQLASLAGYSPIVAGRFVGFGNLAFAIFGTAMLLATAALVSGRTQRVTTIVVVVMGCAAVVIDGAPFLGSDFGGVIALVPAFGTLWILATGRRMSWTRMGALLGAGLVVVAVIATLDYMRPEASRTHLGRFVQAVVDGDAMLIVQRKLEANISLLTNSVLTLMVPLVLVFLAFLVRRPSGLLPWTFVKVPSLRAGLFAVLVLGVVGALVNDSGVAIPAMAATLAIPVAVAVVVRCMQVDDVDGEWPVTPATPARGELPEEASG